MARKVQLANNEYYHIFNRGVDKRVVFQDKYDFERFFQSMQEFNTPDPIGSIYEKTYLHKNKKFGARSPKKGKLINFICYCLNPNHFHFILEQVIDNGIAKFMQKLGAGYTTYFNKKQDRSGCLFQGAFKSQHINTNEYLLHTSVYVNLNNRVHQLGGSTSKSSWREYLGEEKGICCKDSVIKQFNNILEYKEFAENQLEFIKENKILQKLQAEDFFGARSPKK